MTRKDYVKVADILAAEYRMAVDLPSLGARSGVREMRAAERLVIENIAASMADMFAADNPRFDRRRFYVAALGRDTVRG